MFLSVFASNHKVSKLEAAFKVLWFSSLTLLMGNLRPGKEEDSGGKNDLHMVHTCV